MAEFKYWAFLSYSHVDRNWGDWLHKALETYRVPRRLVGKESRDGQVPQRVYPIFRDREELAVSADLGLEINEALHESRYLIVICSPHATQSRWVEQEIIEFKKLGGEDRILALIVDGEPNSSDGRPGFADDECFPKPMRYRLAANGELSTQPAEPLAADVREGKDGKDNAKLKLLAGLIGVNYDELRQREHERRVRRARIVGLFATLLTAIFAFLACWAIIQKRETQRLLVVSDGNRAEEFFANGNSASALVFLARAVEQDPDRYSAVADRLWFALTERSWPLPISAPMLHNDRVLSASFDKDGRRIVTASQDYTARIWDAKTGAALGAPLPHRGLVRQALFTPDGSRVLTICFDGIARLWDASSGQRVTTWEIEHPDAINSLAFSPSGKWVATGSRDGLVRVSDLTTGNPCGKIKEDQNVHTLSFHPTDDTRLLSVSGSVAKLWRLPSGEALFEMRHQGDINSARFTPDGDRIVTASSDRTVRIWDAANGSSIGQPITHDEEVSNAVLSPNGQLLATTTGRRLNVWDMPAPYAKKYAFDYDEQVGCTAFSPDNLVLFSGINDGTVTAHNMLTGEPSGESIHEDGAIVTVEPNRSGDQLLIATANGKVRVWQSPPRFPTSTRFAQAGSVESMSLSPNDQFLLAGSGDGKARLWNLRNPGAPAKQLVHEADVLSAAFSADSTYVLTGGADAKARLWLAVSGDLIGQPLVHAGTVSKVLFSPEGNLFATATEDGTAQFWDVTSQRPVGKAMSHGGNLITIDFDHDGKRFLTAGSDGLRFWYSRTGEPAGFASLATKEITCACFSPKTYLVAAGFNDGTIALWSEAAFNKPFRQFVAKARIIDVAFSPDEKFLVGGSQDGTATIWNISTGKAVGDLLRHTDAVSKVVFGCDSRKLATASEDGTVRVWDAATGRALTELMRHQEAVRCLVFSKDARTLFSGSRDGAVEAWDVGSNMAPSDRAWLAKFARSIVPARLNAAGRIQFQTIAARETLHSQKAPSSGPTRTLFDWFFARPLQRKLTPYSKTTLVDYLGESRKKHLALSVEEERFFVLGTAR